jgi:hypothetical protein
LKILAIALAMPVFFNSPISRIASPQLTNLFFYHYLVFFKTANHFFFKTIQNYQESKKICVIGITISDDFCHLLLLRQKKGGCNAASLP